MRIPTKISAYFFLITPATTLTSIFLFAFGVSALSYFLTGQQDVDIWTVLKTLESLPDPREFITGSMKAYNLIVGSVAKIKPLNTNNQALNSFINSLLVVVRILSYFVGALASIIISALTFPIYCVFFAFRSCSAMLVWLGIDVPYISNISWDELFGDWRLAIQ